MPPKTSSASSSVPTLLPSKFKTSIFAIFQLIWTASIFACARLLFRFTSRRFLRRLQRIDRGRSGKSTTLARWLLGLEDHHVRALRSRHRALDQQQIVFAVDAADLQIAHRHLVRAHVPGHALPFEHARRK